MPEVFNNYPLTPPSLTLTLAVLIGDATIHVANTAPLSLTGNYRLIIEDEILLATSAVISGPDLVISVTRGIEGTSAAAHSLGVLVEPGLTAAALRQLRADAFSLPGLVSVVNGSPTTLDVSHLAASCQTTTGTTSVTLPASSVVFFGMRAMIWDDQNDSATNNITIHGNGANVEDPNSLGSFASSVLIKTNSQSIMWAYDGTQWKLVTSNSSGGSVGGYGVIDVTNSSPGTFTSAATLASVDSSTGTTSVTAPAVGSLPSSGLGWRIHVVDVGGAASTSPIAVNGGGPNIEDPFNPGAALSSISLNVNYAGVIWAYNGTAWKVVAVYFPSAGSTGANLPNATFGSPANLSAVNPTATADSSTGVTSIFAPAVSALPAAGVGFTSNVIDVGGATEANPITFNGNGKNVEDPNNPGTYAPTAVIKNNYSAHAWIYNGTNWKIAGRKVQLDAGLPVSHGATGTFTGNRQIARVNTSTGSTAVVLTAAPLNNYLNTVVDTAGQASLNPIAVTAAGGLNIEDPGNPGSFASSVSVTLNGASVTWIYDNANTRWKTNNVFHSSAKSVIAVTNSTLVAASTLTSAHSGATADSSTGTTTIYAPATVGLPGTAIGWPISVRDIGGQASTHNITVATTDGKLIEDPSNPGTFGSTATIKNNYTAHAWIYDGSTWKTATASKPLPFTRPVSNGSPVTLTGNDDIALADSSTGTTSVALVGSPLHGYVNTVIDRAAQASVSPISVTATGGLNLEDPGRPGTFTTPVLLTVDGASVGWQYDSTQNNWKVKQGHHKRGMEELVVVHAAAGNLTSKYQGAWADSSTGTTIVNAPPITFIPGGGHGWKFYVKDIGGQAATSHITVNGNGFNIEDPNNPGTFASGVVVNNNYSTHTWFFDGGNWKLVTASKPLVSTISVTNGGGLATLTGHDQVALADSSTGTTSVALVASPLHGYVNTVVDRAGMASTSPITVTATGGLSLEDPSAPGTYASSVLVALNGASVGWQYDSAQNNWKVKQGHVKKPANDLFVTHAAAGTLTSAYRGAYCDSTTGTTIVNAPLRTMMPTAATTWEFFVKDSGGQAVTNNITVNGNGTNIEDPNNPGTVAASVAVKNSWSSHTWHFNGTAWRLVVAGKPLTYTLPVVNGVTGTLTGHEQTALADSSTGTTAVALTASPLQGYVNSVVDRAALASVSPVTVTAAGGLNLEDPGKPGSFATSVKMVFDGSSCGWQWDSTENNWKLVRAFHQPAHKVLAVTHAGTGQLTSAYDGATADSSTGTTTVNAPFTANLPNNGIGWSMFVRDLGGVASSSNITISGNGNNIEDPSNPGTFASSVVLTVNYATAKWTFDGVNWKLQSTTFGNLKRYGMNPLLAGLASTQNGSATPLRVGNLLFKPSDWPVAKKVYFRVVLETTGASYQANIDLVDVNNVLGNGANTEVPGSLLQTVATTATELEVELTTAGGNLEILTSNILLYARIWLTTTSIGQSVTCSHAGLYVSA